MPDTPSASTEVSAPGSARRPGGSRAWRYLAVGGLIAVAYYLVPAVGLAYSERAFLKILDESNKMTAAELRGTVKLPNPIKTTSPN